MLELFFYFMSTVSLFVLELLYCVTVGQDLADVYKKQQNVKKLINGNSCDLFPDNFWERLLTTLKDLENNNHGYLALAMFYKYWTDDEVYNEFKCTLREAKRWNGYFLTCCLQELKKISLHPVDTENGPEEATFFLSWKFLC